MIARAHPGSAYRPDIDGMRAVAVLGVVAFHVNPVLAPGGFAGVDIFFVISGYLISSIIIGGLEEGSFRVGEFYARRLTRLLPALTLVLAVTWGLGWFSLLPGEYQQLGLHTATGAGFVANIAYWTESGYFDSEAAAKPLLHLWSLGVEEQFYLVWPALLALGWRLRLNLLHLILLIAAASFALNVGTVASHPAAAFYLPTGRFWELLVGGALGYLSLAGRAGSRLGLPPGAHRVLGAPLSVRHAMSVCGALLLAASLVLLGGRSVPGWWALLPTAGAALTIAAGRDAWFNRVVLSHRALVLVGLFSYPLYLWHWPLLALARIVESGEPGQLVIAGIVVASVLLAWLTYRFIERPIRAAQRRGATGVVPAQLAFALVLVGAAGMYVHVRSRELPRRFPASVQSLVDFQFDYATAYRERQCYLMPDQTRDAFGSACVDSAPRNGPLLLLWGDSHAAHLYPGLRRLQRDAAFRLAQFTGSACPPLLSVDIATQPFCRDVNDSVIERIADLQPDIVLLAARWDVYDQAHLDETVAAIRRVSHTRIVVLGPVPNWTTRIPRILFNEFRRNPMHGVPHRLHFIDGNYDRAEHGLRDRARRLGVEYVSAYRILCNAEGCLAKIGDGPGGVTTWDDQHLTSEGSEYVVEHLADRLFPAGHGSDPPGGTATPKG